MKKEDLFREIGEIDEELIEEAAEAGSGRDSLGKEALIHKKKGIKKLMDIVPLVAACFVLIWIVSSGNLLFQKSNEAETTAAGITTAAAITEAEAPEEMQNEGAESWLEDERTEGGLETVAAEETTAASAMESVVSGSGHNTGTTEETLSYTEPSSPVTDIVVPWDELDIFQKYAEFSRNGKIYSVTDREFHEHELREKLDVIKITGMDTANNEKHEIYAEIWLIDGVEEECALAVRYEGDDRYFGAVNREHCLEPWK